MINKQGLFSRGSQPSPSSLTGRPAGSESGLSGNAHAEAYPASSSTNAPAGVTAATPRPSNSVDHKTDPVEAKTDSGSRLIVGPNVKLKGAEIQDCDTLVVEGRVEATMDSRVIQIAQEGSFSGKVGIDVAEVYGNFEGELTARSQLIIHASGKVSGKIRYGKIFIEEGGELSGDVASIATESSSKTTLRATNTLNS